MKKLTKKVETLKAAEVAREAHEAHKEAKRFLNTLNVLETLGFLVALSVVYTGIFQIQFFVFVDGGKQYFTYWIAAFITMCCITAVHITNLVAKATKGTDLLYGTYLVVIFHIIRLMAKEVGQSKLSPDMFDFAYLLLLQKYVEGKKDRREKARKKLAILFSLPVIILLILHLRKEE